MIRLSRDGPWNFASTFPEPLMEELARAGRCSIFNGSKHLSSDVRGIHDETAIGLRADIAVVLVIDRALVTGADPGTGKPLKPEQRKALRKERDSYLETLRGTLVEYQNEFGTAAADEFERFSGVAAVINTVAPADGNEQCELFGGAP